MLGRLGLSGRLMAIVLLALLALWATNISLSYLLNRQQPQDDSWAILPERAAAVVELLDHADQRERALILKAINSETVSATLLLKRPQGEPANLRLPNVEWIIGQYLHKVGNREVVVTLAPEPRSAVWRFNPGHLTYFAREPLKVAIALGDGAWISFETRVEVSPAVLGVPPGFVVGLVGAIVGIAALVAIAREAKPLRELALSVSRFAKDALPRPVDKRGAPEIASLIGAVNDMQGQIAALLKGRAMLLGAISHDLKTFITRLRLRVETMPEGEQHDRAVRDLDDMTALIDTALAVARGGAGLERRELIDIASLLWNDVADRVDADVSFDRGSPAQALTVQGDRAALRRLFDNLIDNGVRYGGHVRMSADCVDGRVVVLVDDNGPGIPEVERAAVFEPFYRLETSRSRATGGSGLGLAIARQIALAHDGQIHIETSPMGGARLAVSLPKAA